MNNIVMDNMMRQCVYNNVDVAGTCPIWVWVLLGVVIAGCIGLLVWMIVKTLMW